MRRVDVAYCLVADELGQKVLLVKNRHNQEWTLPGGAVASGETLAEAARRQAMEEAGVEVTVGRLVAVNECKMTQADVHLLFFTFLAVLENGAPHVVRPYEIVAVEWVDMPTADARLPYHPNGLRRLMQGGCPYRDEGTK
jgi:8-oxo-dGTP diphosphatase